jgi:hypothetical protein
MKFNEWKETFGYILKDIPVEEQFTIYSSAHIDGYTEGFKDGKRNTYHLEMIDPKPIEPVDAISNVSYENGVFRKYDGVYNTVSK